MSTNEYLIIFYTGKSTTFLIYMKKPRNTIDALPRIKVLVAHLCPTLCNPMGCSPSGFSVHGIHQARIMEWVVMPFSRGYS